MGPVDPTRSATPSTALVPQRKVGFPLPNARLLLGFHGTKTARREGISSPFSDAGGCTSPRTQGPSNRQGASMRSLRKAARNVAVFHLPCGTLSTRRSPFGAQPRSLVHVGLRPGLIDEDQTPGINVPLVGAPARTMAAYVRAILFHARRGLLLTVTSIRRKKRLIIEVSALTPRSADRRSHRA